MNNAPVLLVVALATFAASHHCAMAQVPTDPQHFSIMDDNPPIGSNIRRERIRWVLPFDKRYAELTDEQKHLFKSQYESMKENDEPPFPSNGLGSLFKTLVLAQDRLLVEGELRMDVAIDAQGNAQSVAVLQSPSPEMTRITAGVLMFEKFKPAICDGRPCAMNFPLRVNLLRRW